MSSTGHPSIYYFRERHYDYFEFETGKCSHFHGYMANGLGIVYAVIAIEVFVVAHLMVSHKILQMPAFMHHGKVSVLHAPKAAATGKHGSDELNYVYSLVTAVLLAGYLHLKLSVDAGSRNRLTKLKARTVSEETTFEDIQREHILLGSLLASANVITEEELIQALELSRRTHRLLGDTIVSLGFLQDADIERALALQQKVKARTISREKAQLSLAVDVSQRISSSTLEKLTPKPEAEAARPVKKLTGFDIPIRHFSVMQELQPVNGSDPAASFSTLPDIFGKVSCYETIDGHRREVEAQPQNQQRKEPSSNLGFSVPQSMIIAQDSLPALDADRSPTACDTIEDWKMNTVKQQCNSWESTRSVLFQTLVETDVDAAAVEIELAPAKLSCSDLVDTLFDENVPLQQSVLCETEVDASTTSQLTVNALRDNSKPLRKSSKKAKRTARKRK